METPNIPATLLKLATPTRGLKYYHKNPRKGDVERIKESLTANGQYRPIVVNKGTHTGRPNEVLAGNHTLKAARELDWAKIAATFVDVDDEQCAKIVLVDNRSNELGTYDNDALADLLRSVEDLSGTGFTDAEAEDLYSHLQTDDLDKLAEEFGDPNESDLWPTIKFKLPQELFDRLSAALKATGASTDAERVQHLLDRAER